MSNIRVRLRPQQGIKVGSTNKYLFDPDLILDAVEDAKDWATKTDGEVDETDYSAKAYAIGGTGTETNNSKYYSEQAGISASKSEIWAEGSDAEVESLGGVHSAKGWAEFSKESPFMLYQPRLSTQTDFGTFVLLKFPFGKTMLVDAGYTGQETAIDNFLASINVTHIDVFMITHFHADHSGCAVHIIDNYCDDKTLFYKCMDVDYSQFTTDESGCATREAAYKSALTAKGYTYTIPQDGKSISLYDDRLNLTFYNTDTSNLPTYYNSTMPENTDGHSNANNTSMCCLIESCGSSVFVTGDIEFDGQVAVAPKVPTCDILQVPHHAVNQNGYYKFFDTLNPKIAFFNYNTGLPQPDRKYWFKYLFQTGRKCATISNNTSDGIIFECYNGDAKRFSGEMFDWSFVSWARTYYITDNFPYYNDTTHNARLVANWTIADLVDMTKYAPKNIKIRVNTSHECTQLISELETVTSKEYGSWIISPAVEKIRIESASHATNKVVYAESVSSYYNDYSISKMMSNCVLKSKRRIVLELNSGTLTLKKGSEIYVPNGVGVYDDIATTNNLTLTASTNGQYLVAPSAGGTSMQARKVEQCTYGAGATAVGAFAYDTTTNKIFNYSGEGVQGGQYGLPIALITVSNGAISSIDCIFNEFGFIGNDIFSLPMISGFIANGRDSNGYMTEIYFSTSEIMHCSESNAGERYIMLNGNTLDNYEEANYDLDTNIVWNSSNPKISMCICGKITRGTGGVITSFKPKFGLKVTDYNEFIELSKKVDTKQDALTAGTGIDINSNTISVSSPTLTNLSTGTSSLSILGANTVASSATNIGVDSTAGTNGTALGKNANSGNGGLALGTNSKANGSWSTAVGDGNSDANSATATASGAIAFGHDAHATADNAIQIGEGTNATTNSLQVGSYELLDTSTGLIPDGRISTNIARSADKANISLDNLNATGQMVIDSDNGMISQKTIQMAHNIKALLFNNIITLDNGSILTNTGLSYATTTLTAAQTYTISNSLADGNYLLCSNGTAIQAPLDVSVTGSGASNPADGSTYSYFYNTTDMKIYAWDGSSWVDSGYCYPFAEIVMSSGVATFAKDSYGNNRVFNGLCYIGGHIIVYPDNKGLCANEFNSDGTLASTYVKTTKLSVLAMNYGALTGDWVKTVSLRGSDSATALVFFRFIKNYDELLQQSARLQYVEQDNVSYVYQSGGFQKRYSLPIVIYEYTNSKVERFDILLPIRKVTADMLYKKQDTITSISGYDATKTQTLKNVSGTLTWVDD